MKILIAVFVYGMALCLPSLMKGGLESASDPNPLSNLPLHKGEKSGLILSSDKATTEQLDRAIKEVIAQREYQWRMPREVVEEKDQGLLFEFLEGVANYVKRFWKMVSDLWEKITDWLRKQLSSGSPPGSSKEWSAGELNVMIIILIVLLALIVLFFLWRHRKRMREAEVIQSEAILPLPDIADENLVADQLPEEGWQRMAQDLLARGELRLALRAMFMATLAYLAQSQLIT